jgi:hypothetical protein
MLCKKCGNSLPDSDKFCKGCGERVEIIDNTKNVKKKSSSHPIRVFIIIVYFIVGMFIVSAAKVFIHRGHTFETYNDKTTASNITTSFSWQEFNPPSGKFKIEFPAPPTYEQKREPISGTNIALVSDMYSSVPKDGAMYLLVSGVQVGDDSLHIDDPDSYLKELLKLTLAQNASNKLISSQMVSFGEYKANDYSIERLYLLPGAKGDEWSDFGILHMRGKNVIVEDTVYKLVAVYDSQNYDENDYNRFIASFTLQ